MVQIPTFTRTPNGSGVVTNESDVAAIQRALAEVALSSEPAFTNFADHAALAAADVPDAITTVYVDGHRLVADETGVAGTSNGGDRKWSPAGNPVHVAAFGIGGAVHDARAGAQSSARYMATPSDDGAALEAVFLWCLTNGRSLMGDPRKVYGSSRRLIWGPQGALTFVADGTTLMDFNLSALAHASNWWTGTQTGDDPDAWNFGQELLLVGIPDQTFFPTGVCARNIRIDGRRIAPVGFAIRGLQDSRIEHIVSERCVESEWLKGAKGNLTAGTFLSPAGGWAKCTDCVIRDIKTSHYAYLENSSGVFGVDDGTGHYGLTGRTSRGMVVSGADSQLVECNPSTGLNSLVLRHSFSVTFNGGRVWNGAARTNTNSTSVIVSSRAFQYMFNGTQISDGAVVIRGFDGQFNGCTFKQFTHNQIRLVATEADETAAGLVFDGNRCDEDDGVLLTEGSGTWGTFAGTISASVTRDGTAITFSA